jgi:signal transduction histidine kinase
MGVVISHAMAKTIIRKHINSSSEKMKLKIYSFRTKIIVTLILVISVVSYLSFHLYSNYLSQKIYSDEEKNVSTFLYQLKDEITNIHDGRLLKKLLLNMEKDNHVINTYLLDAQGNIKQATDSASASTMRDIKKFKDSGEEMSVRIYRDQKVPFSRAFLHVYNSPECYKCHSPEQNTLGYITIDFSLEDPTNYIVIARNSSLIFTVLMVVIILIFVLLMHYRFVKKSLYGFRNTIYHINEGDLSQRVSIPESKELGQLGKSFNQMMEKFQQTQIKLLYYHQKELQDAQKLASIGEMSARLAHDIRNPLTGIVNSIEVISGEMKESPYKPILEEIQRQANRVNNAISNLLKYSRPVEITMRDGNINELVDSLVLFLKSQKVNKQINFLVELDKQLPNCSCDPEQLENVLMNLGLNAIQAIEKEGQITFRTAYDKTSKMISISVQDSGPGIPPEREAEVFKPFFTTKTEGTGLGLAIAKDIIEKHKGEIRFENIPGTGCKFTISFPLEFHE